MLALLQRAAAPSLRRSDALAVAIRRRVRSSAQFALSALGDAGGSWLPDCAAPISPRTDVSVTAQADRLRQLPGDALQAELHAVFGPRLPLGWRAAAEHPRRWLHALAHASLDAWQISAQHWQAAGPLLDREIGRVGAATVRGGVDVLLNTLHRRIRYTDGMLSFAGVGEHHVDLADRRLVLLPMIAGPDAVFACFDLPDLACVAYPLRGRGAENVSDRDALALVLGAPRAAILRLLDRPCTVHELAAAVHCAPNTATYHCQQLESAGLVSRRRDNRVVRVSLTDRGVHLLDLLCD
jgi:DNA-binding transcriptional ArsR family regulator